MSQSSEPGPGAPTARRRLVLAMTALGLLVVAIDQLTKVWAESALTDRAPIPLIGEFLQLRLIYNSGAAFSLASGQTWLLTVLVVVVLAVAVRISRKVGSRGWVAALGLLIGGAVGNLIDRLFRPPSFAEGHVVDFIDYNGWFVGNVADIAIVAGAILMALLSFRGIRVDGSRQTATPSSPDDVSRDGALPDPATRETGARESGTDQD